MLLCDEASSRSFNYKLTIAAGDKFNSCISDTIGKHLKIVALYNFILFICNLSSHVCWFLQIWEHSNMTTIKVWPKETRADDQTVEWKPTDYSDFLNFFMNSDYQKHFAWRSKGYRSLNVKAGSGCVNSFFSRYIWFVSNLSDHQSLWCLCVQLQCCYQSQGWWKRTKMNRLSCWPDVKLKRLCTYNFRLFTIMTIVVWHNLIMKHSERCQGMQSHLVCLDALSQAL